MYLLYLFQTDVQSLVRPALVQQLLLCILLLPLQPGDLLSQIIYLLLYLPFLPLQLFFKILLSSHYLFVLPIPLLYFRALVL